MRAHVPVLAILLAAASVSAGNAPTAAVAFGHRFILLLYEGAAFDASVSHVAEYTAWARELRTGGRPVTGDEILPGGESLPAGDGLEKERLGGYFVVGARDLADAVAVGRGCPHRRHGGRVVVRPLAD